MEAINDKKSMHVVINAAWCKGCGICIELCPKGALVKDNKEKAVWQYPEKCNSCGLCELRCPDLAIIIRKSEEDV
jgi:2-oxoglutarate ferredoxin oxidoreductase subunit delta